MKFGFPMAATTTLLAWSVLEYKDAYEASGELDNMYDCLRWPLEWLLKCHTKPEELYVQVRTIYMYDCIRWPLEWLLKCHTKPEELYVQVRTICTTVYAGR